MLNYITKVVCFDLSGCQRLMASIVDATQVEKNMFENIVLIWDFFFGCISRGITRSYHQVKQYPLGIELSPGMTPVLKLYIKRRLGI